MSKLSDHLNGFVNDDDWGPYLGGRVQGVHFVKRLGGNADRPALVVTASIPDEGRWHLKLTLDVSTEEPVVVSLTIESADPVALGQLPVTTIRDLRVSEVVEQIHRILSRTRGYSQRPQTAWRLAGDFRRTERPGRRGRDDIHYAKIAELYVNLLGDPAPVQRLAKQLHVKEQAARDLLRQARRRELLTQPDQGRAGGALTPKARKLLDGEH